MKKYGKGYISCIYDPVFGTYSFSHFPGVRQFIARGLDMMELERLVRVKALASIK
jgi:hypothetical protein